MQVVRKRTKQSFPNHPSATSISNRQREVALSIDPNSHMKGGPVIQYSSHGKKLNIHADSTKPLWTATRLPLWGLAYLISIQSPQPPFQGGDQGLRAFHRRNGFPCPPASARHLMMPYLIPPIPLSKGAIRAYGLSIAAMAFPARQLRPGI